MPSIKEIDLSDGIRLVKSNGDEIVYTLAQMAAFNGTAAQLEQGAVDLLTEEYSWNINQWEPDHRIRQDPPILRPNERIEGNKVIITVTFAAVHIFNFPITSSSDYIVRLSTLPIEDNWWL